jgi:E3 ubiquitin-protein ligase SIAH1
MEGMPRALDEDLLRELKCTVCKQYMVPIIYLCIDGHSICSKCREKRQKSELGFQRGGVLYIRNVALENITRSQKYPCDNRQSGCLDLFSNEDIAQHLLDCVYREFDCPLQLYGKCSSKYMKSDMTNHLEKEHPGSFMETSTLSSVLFQDKGVRVLFCFGELFVHHQQEINGKFYCAVQLIGTSSEASKYKCEFTLRAENGIEQISNTFLVQGYSEEWGTIFNSGKCLHVDEVTVKHFGRYNNRNWTITLSTV